MPTESLSVAEVLALTKSPSARAKAGSRGKRTSPAVSTKARQTQSSSQGTALLPMPVMTFRLLLPPTVNTYYRHVGPKVLISAKGRQYRGYVVDAIREIGERMQPGRYSVSVVMMPPDRRRRDLDNLAKSLWDSLTHAGVWDDDSLVDDMRIVRGGIDSVGRVAVTIRVIDSAILAGEAV